MFRKRHPKVGARPGTLVINDQSPTPVIRVVRYTAAEVTEDEIKQYCRGRLANNKIPVTIVFRNEIPRTPTGKILKRELRDALEKVSR